MGSKIIYVCDWLPPDFGAVGQYTLKFAREAAGAGAQVVLIGLSSRATSEVSEAYGSGRLKIVRLRAAGYSKDRLVARALWTAWIDLRLAYRAARELRGAAEVVFTGSPPFLIHLVVPLCRTMGVATRYRITDFYPECLMAGMTRIPIWLRGLYRLTLFWRRRVNRIEVLGEDQRTRLLEAGIDGERIVLSRDESPIEFPSAAAPRASVIPEALRGHLIVLYSGNYGVAHDHDTFIRGWHEYQNRHPAQPAGLWLNATGTRVPAVQNEASVLALPCARTAPCAVEDLPGVLLAADVHLITLRDEFVGYVLPSKVYACVASGRPVLFVGSADSDVHRICRERMRPEHYRRADIGDVQGIVAALAWFAATAVRRGESAEHGSDAEIVARPPRP